MSENYAVNNRGADAFNLKTGLQNVGWAHALPMLVDDFIDDHGMPDDVVEIAAVMEGDGITSRPFRRLVGEYQKRHGLSKDSKLGAGTWRHMLARQNVPDFGFGHIRVARMKLAVPRLSRAVRVDDTEYTFDAFRQGCKSRRSIVVHWGGLNPGSCWNVLQNAGLSSHLLANHEIPEDGVYVVYQAVDLAHTAYHAGRINSNSIGIDICRSPLTRFKKQYGNPKSIPNPMSGHLTASQKYIIPLPEDMAEAFRIFLAWLAQIFKIPFGRYPGDGPVKQIDAMIAGTDDEWRGVVGHHNVPDGHKNGKWDVAPWAPQIWNEC